MATQRPQTAAGTAEPGPADNLTPEEQAAILNSDARDNAVKAEEKPLTGKRVRAIPAVITTNGDRGTTVEVRQSDFAAHGVKQDTVRFDRFKDNFTLAVGSGSAQISEEAAELLTKNWPQSFEYIDG